MKAALITAFSGHVRALRGRKVYAEIPGARCGRTSVISASMGKRLVSPMLFDGHCNRAVVESYLSEVLLQSIPAGSLIVLDNASFHRSPSTQALVEAAGCELMFLPAYSPDLNPIEHIWATLKNACKTECKRPRTRWISLPKNAPIYAPNVPISG